MAERVLITLAQDAEDASSGLRVFRDSLPRNATRITAVISEFFAISASLRQLDSAEGDPRFQPSFYRIRDDVGLLCRSLQANVSDVFAMFARSRGRSRQMVWEDLQHKMEQDEGEGLLERLQCYRGILQALFEVVTGRRPSSLVELRRQLASLAAAQGVVSSLSVKITQDGFIIALQLPFDGERLWVRIYWRPADNRTRVLIMTKASNGLDRHYCVPLVSLKIVRDRSCLKLCRARQDGRYDLWAKLNFATYERMVLFYCTFVAMKRQDERGVPHPVLLDSFELDTSDGQGERELFAGVIEHGDMRHALRLFRDRASGGVRLEASAKRGPMQDVPIWTAFVTKYVGDRDWPQYERDGVVSLAAIRPPPYVFLPRYEPARNRADEYVLQFTISEDGRQFIEVWVALCRS
ncbi:hypothetical protein B0A55_06711 [Friedmanniomyces simplex]|uniref:Uncharacterized protein n=1 Tax=Friedmanniomyces simplex TaxID=329884 RepID=A0A4U0X6E3_9PEZI|nr:hypothetical protein B0A55_06711 [Friedmanniomyces simplex]